MPRFPKVSILWKVLIGLNIYSMAVVWLDFEYFPHQELKEAGAITVTAAIMSLLLAFRTNTAYDRWWEARKLWGQLVNDSRNLGLKARNYLSVNLQDRKEYANLLIAFPYALRDHLRGQRPSAKVLDLVPKEVAEADHVPLQIADLIYLLAQNRTTGSDRLAIDKLIIDPHLRSMMDICGGCERILSSPIARTYKEMIWLLLGVYLLLLPWILVPIIDLWAAPVMLVASYFAVSLELLAEEVEEPFGTEPNDLPLDTICATIERSIHQLAD
jgi:putative membrane protein